MTGRVSSANLLRGMDCQIGVEFEFLIPVGRFDISEREPEDSNPHDRRWYPGHWLEPDPATGHPTTNRDVFRYIACLLRTAGLPALDNATQATTSELTAAAETQGVDYSDERPGPPLHYRFWSIASDSSVLLDEWQSYMKARYVWPRQWGPSPEGFELGSPVLRSADFEADVHRALTKLRRHLRILNSSSAGLHIHLSDPPSAEWSHGGVKLSTAKKMMTLVLVAEDTIYSRFCAPQRADSKYCRLLREIMWDGSWADDKGKGEAPPGDEDIRDFVPRSLREGDLCDLLEKVWSATKHHELLYPYAGLVVKCSGNMVEEWEMRTWTLEMRQLEGTMDPTLVCRWAQFCCALLEIAMAPAAEYKARLAEIDRVLTANPHVCGAESCGWPTRPGKCRVGDLGAFLAAIGIPEPEAVEFWLQKKRAEPKNGDRPVADTEFLPRLD